MRRKHLVALLAIAAIFVLFPPPAEASGADTGAGTDGDRIQGVAQRDGTQRKGPTCDWASVDATGTVGTGRSAEAQIQTFDGTTHILFQRTCPNTPTTLIWIPQTTAQTLLPALRDQVEAQLHHPEPIFQPIDNNNLAYVQIPLDFRTTPQTWQPIVATASIDGPPGLNPWITITAQPTQLQFTSGDPHDPHPTTTCTGNNPTAPYHPDHPGTCSHTYRNASTITNTNHFQTQLAITWTITYNSSDGPGTLTMNPTTTTTTPIQISEIKALLTCTRPNPQHNNC